MAGSGARAREPVVVENVEAVVAGRTLSGSFDCALRASLRMTDCVVVPNAGLSTAALCASGRDDRFVGVLTPPCPAVPVEGGAPGGGGELTLADGVGDDGAPETFVELRLVGEVEGVGGDLVAPSWVRRSSTGRRRWR